MPTTRTVYNPHVIARLLRERRTVSQGSLSTAQEPDHRAVWEALESARWAPNHHLTEPWTFYVLDAERIARLGEMWAELQARKGAKPEKVERKRHEWGQSKCVLILTCTSAPDADEVVKKEDYAACCCAAQNLMLHLWAEGLGSKWSTGAVWAHEGFWPLLGHAHAPANTEVIGIFFYGVPERIPEGRRKRGWARSWWTFGLNRRSFPHRVVNPIATRRMGACNVYRPVLRQQRRCDHRSRRAHRRRV